MLLMACITISTKCMMRKKMCYLRINIHVWRINIYLIHAFIEAKRFLGQVDLAMNYTSFYSLILKQ